MDRIFAVLTIVYCWIIFLLSSIHGSAFVVQLISSYDLVCHAVLYGGLGWLAAMTLRAGPVPSKGWRLWVGPMAFVAVYGATDELHQMFVPGRFCAVSDWAADVAGGAAAQLAFPLKIYLDRRRNGR
jgi:VanZ family protein